MNVLGISCSPRIGGNTDILVKVALAGAKEEAEVEFLKISNLQIYPCDGCTTCHQAGKCRIEDDMQKIYPRLLSADGIIVGSPVYFWSVNSHTKILIDRTYALRYPYHQLTYKVGGGIVVTGRRGGMTALSVINNFFLGHDMLATGLGIVGYATNRGEIKQDEHAIQSARSLGKQVVQLIKEINIKRKL